MSAPLERIEVWTALACDSGVAVADLPIAESAACTVTEEIAGNLVTRRLTVAVPRVWTEIAEIVVRRVLRVVYSDGTAFDEFRISELRDSSGGDGLMIITALGIEMDLVDRDLLIMSSVETVIQLAFAVVNTPAYLLSNYVLLALPGTWNIGTVTPTEAIEVAVSTDTPLSLARKIAAAASIVAGAIYELSVRRNGTTGYYIDLAAYGASATAPDVLTGKSLVGLNRSISQAEQTTRCFPVGRGVPSRAYYEVTAVSINAYIEIAATDGSTVNPFLADDEWNGLYWWHEDNVSHLVTDTDRANKRIYMSSTGGIAVGEWGRLGNVTGSDIAYVDALAAQATYGVRMGVISPDVPANTNWAKNGLLGRWSAGAPVDWGASGTVTQTTDARYQRTGGSSAAFLNTLGTRSLATPARSVYCGADWVVTYQVQLYVIAYLAATVNAYLRVYDPNTGAYDTSQYFDGATAGLTATGWVTWSASYVVAAAGVKSIGVSIYKNVTAVGFYIDAVQITVAPPGAAAPSDYVDGSGGAVLRQKALQHLSANADPIVTYEANVLDLYRLDPTLAGQYEVLTLGGTVNLTDTELGITTSQRAVRIETNHLVPHGTRVTLANAQRELTRLLAA